MSRQPRRRSFLLFFLLPFSFFLAAAPGCHLLHFSPLGGDRPEKEPAPATVAKKSELRVSQFVFLYDFDLNRNLPIFRELADLREQVYKDLQLPPSSTPVYVHLFENKESYEQFMQARHADLPKRRAFFVVQPRAIGGSEDLLVYTYWSDRISQDLRHELTHALLHSVLKDVPLWLDEGLAEYFEMPPGWHGVNYQHINLLRRGPIAFHPDLARLEGLTEVPQMTPVEYREAWAWVHLMLHDKAEARRVLIGYLRELRINSRPGLLRPRLLPLFPSLDQALEAHLARLDAATAQR